MLIIPRVPNVLCLSIGRLWNGEKCPDSRISGFVEIQQTEAGILIRTKTTSLLGHKLSEDQPGIRKENIDDWERFCLFFVEDGGQYLEVKLSLGGQYLVSGFDNPHQIVADFINTNFVVRHEIDKDGKIINEIILPKDLFPERLSALNAFLVAGNQALAYYPIFGKEPDFHQPNLFPLAKLEE